MQVNSQDLNPHPTPSPLGYPSARVGRGSDREVLRRDMEGHEQSFGWTDQPMRSMRVEFQGRQVELRRSENQDAQTGLNGQQLAAELELPTHLERPAFRNMFRYHVRQETPKLTRRELALLWVTRNSKDFAGLWVALDGDRLLASGNEAGKVAQAARELGVKIPAMIRIPEGEEIPSAGW